MAHWWRLYGGYVMAHGLRNIYLYKQYIICILYNVYILYVDAIIGHAVFKPSEKSKKVWYGLKTISRLWHCSNSNITKIERFAQNTDERIPNHGKI